MIEGASVRFDAVRPGISSSWFSVRWMASPPG